MDNDWEHWRVDNPSAGLRELSVCSEGSELRDAGTVRLDIADENKASRTSSKPTRGSPRAGEMESEGELRIPSGS